MVGIPGSVFDGFADDTPSGRSLPLRICVITVEMVASEACVSPDTRAVTCGTPPLYGTCTMSIPAIDTNSAIDRCGALPFPDEE
ncbi:hypothetical protein D3C83_72500 [compost metagenome]